MIKRAKLDIEKYYSMADFIILPSLFGEGFSNVLVEGMLTKLFPIATNVGDCVLILEADTDNNDENDNPRIEFRQDGGYIPSIICNGNNSLDI